MAIPKIVGQLPLFPSKPLCSVEGCEKPAWARGLCSTHYTRLHRRGLPELPKVETPRATCTQDGCEKLVLARGLCPMHYQRVWRYGSPDDPHPDLATRFWSKVNKDGPVPAHCPELGPCWLWTAHCDMGGYGKFQIGYSNHPAHRVSWELHNGPKPADMLTLHRCDVRNCVNPAHLFLGTHADNSADCVKKGRQAKGDRNGARLHPERLARGDRSYQHLHPENSRGVRNGRALLTEDDVREIRRLYAMGNITFADLGRQFGVTYNQVSTIVKRKQWTHI